MRRPTARYQNSMIDSTRWEDIALRDGDIVISTPSKCGTTWTQMICALLIFQSTDFPRRLSAMSVWPEVLFHPREEIAAELTAQRHRRFMKTHVPLDGLTYDERVTYITVARDPRDAAISWDNHMANTNFPALMELRAAAVGTEEAGGPPGPLPEPLESARDRFWQWADSPEDMIGLSSMLHHFSTFWQMRDQPNVVFLHYQEMQDDLEGTMRRLAARLGIEVPERKWPELVRAASFDEMKNRADELAPEPGIWIDNNQFFRRGTSGQWRELLDADDLRRYRDRVQELADPELVDWVHHGKILP
jgi:aryl sulfotransferase